MRHAGYGRNFRSTVEELVRRGHEVHVALGAAPTAWLTPDRDPVARLAAAHRTLDTGPMPAGSPAGMRRAALVVRLALDFLRYLEPEYRAATRLRVRAERKLPAALRWQLTRPVLRRPGARRALRRILRRVERNLPRSRAFERWLTQRDPDVVVVTPLVELGAPQTDVVRSARAAGIPVALCVASWDNLTNKGVIHERPDRVLVWNARQRDEAVALHGMAPAAVVATGAQAYDHWFTWEPSTDREAFCSATGLDATRPYLLYLCSSPFIAPAETDFVAELVARLRDHADERLAGAGVLVRPHPQNAAQWAQADVAALGANVAVWPRGGNDPVDEAAQRGYFDSIHHSAAVTGVNTSALIEAGVVGRAVHTLLDHRFSGSQSGTLHFAHLTEAGGGLLRVAHTWAEHLDGLAATLREGPGSRERNRAFLEAFVRPAGLDRPATPAVVDAIEALAAQKAR